MDRFLPNLKNIPLIDIINHDQFCNNLFKGFDFIGNRPKESDVAFITVLRYHTCKKWS